MTDPDDSDSPSVSDLRANVDAVRGSSGAFAVAGSLGVGGGNEINVAGGSGPVVTRGGAGKGTGKLSGRKRGKKVRGKVKAFKALSKVRGTIDKAAVYKAISKHMHKIQRCYERQVMKKGNLSGKVTAEWSIGTNGRVKRAKIKLSTLNSRKVDSCLLKVIKKIKFPKPKGGDVIVVYPFIFSLAR